MCDIRTQILDAAETLIQNLGLNSMSYRHISDALGIREAGIHDHFSGKEDLVNELLMRCHMADCRNYREIVARPLGAPEKLRKLAAVYEAGLSRGQLCFVGTIGADLSSLQKSSCQILEETIGKTVEIFSEAFEQGREEGSLAFDRSVGDAAYLFFLSLVGAQIAAVTHGGQAYFRRVAETMISGWEVRSPFCRLVENM